MAKNPWIEWTKSNILEIIILILVLALLIKAYSPTQEVSKVQVGEVEVSKEAPAVEQIQPPIVPVEQVQEEPKAEEKSTE